MEQQKESSVRLFQKVENDLSVSHIRLLFAVDMLAKENEKELLTGKLLDDFQNAADAITATYRALKCVRAILGLNENGEPVESAKETGAV